MSKKRRVKEIDFTGDGHHCALVSRAANGESVLLMKNKETKLKKQEVKITTSMKKFLETFFNLWDDEAATLASILGYDVKDWYYDYVGEDTEIELIKSMVDEGEEVKVSKETYDLLKVARPEFNKLKKAYDAEKEVIMTKEKDVDLQKSIDEAVAAALKKEKEKLTDLEKSLKDKETELTDLRKAAEKKEKDEMIELCKGYSFVEDAEVLADSLFLCKSIKGYDVILDTLEKAREAVKASLEKEIGTDEEVKVVNNTDLQKSIDKTTELLKARKEGK